MDVFLADVIHISLNFENQWELGNIILFFNLNLVSFIYLMRMCGSLVYKNISNLLYSCIDSDIHCGVKFQINFAKSLSDLPW